MTKPDQLKGYAYPSPKGISSLVGDLPWHYGTEHLDIVFTADPDAIASFLPEPLQPGENPDRVVISFGKWWSLWENGLDLPFVNPERTWYMETILWVGSSLDGKQGKTCIQSWVDNDFTMARGMYMGFNKKLGKTVMTDLQSMNPRMASVGKGTRMSGYTVSHGERLFEGSVTLEEQVRYEELPDPILKTPFNIRYFPSIMRDAPPSVFEVVRIDMENFRQSEYAWAGEAAVRLLPSVLEEYMVLEPREILGGYYFFNGSTVLGGEVLHSWV